MTVITRDNPLPVLPESNITAKFREAFEAFDTNRWSLTIGDGDIVQLDGNTASASYLVVSKSPWLQGTQTTLETLASFNAPVELSYGLSISQRNWGQEFSVEIVDTEGALPQAAEIAISAINQTSQTLTVDTVAPHGLNSGVSIGIRDCSDARFNYPAVVVASVLSPTQFTVTAGPIGTITSQTLSNPAGAKGSVFLRERLGRARNGMSQIFESTSATGCSLYVRSESGDVLPSGTINGQHNVSCATTSPTQAVNGPYAYAFLPTSEYRMNLQADRVQWFDHNVDTLSQSNSRGLRTQVCPDPTKNYKFRVRANNSRSYTVLTAKVLSLVKSGTTTATFTTDRPHELVTGDNIVYYGSSNGASTHFPNLTSSTTVTVTGPNTFTAVIGTGTTGSAAGGVIAKVHGVNTSIGFINLHLVSAALVTLSDGTRQLNLTAASNWSGLSIGDYVNVEGVMDANSVSLTVDGAWKVANISTTLLSLIPVSSNPTLPADFGSTNCGGAVIRRTDLRLSFVRIFDFERLRVETMSRPNGDASGSLPAVITGGGVAMNGGSNNVGFFGFQAPVLTVDVSSSALTANSTTSAITPSGGASYEVNIVVTAVSGTNPTLDLVMEESDDTGTNWFPVYAFPRITGSGIYRSPVLPLTGNRVRYVQTVGGTSPSFTRTINRLQTAHQSRPTRQIIDRSVNLTTLNSVTPSLTTHNCENLQLVVNIGAASTPPQLQLEGTDDNGLTWYPIGAPLAAVANSTVRLTVLDVQAQLVRARVSTAGTSVTMGYVLMKAWI